MASTSNSSSFLPSKTFCVGFFLRLTSPPFEVLLGCFGALVILRVLLSATPTLLVVRQTCFSLKSLWVADSSIPLLRPAKLTMTNVGALTTCVYYTMPVFNIATCSLIYVCTVHFN